LAVLGSQGIVVNCTAAIFFRTVDLESTCFFAALAQERGNSTNISLALSATDIEPMCLVNDQ